jgi:transposase
MPVRDAGEPGTRLEAWPRACANSRETTAKTMTTTTVALLRTQPQQFDAVDVRTALREWGFNAKRRAKAPDEVKAIRDWVRRTSAAHECLGGP